MKKHLRKQMRQTLAAIPAAEAAAKSLAAAGKLVGLPEFAAARTVMAFLSVPGEIDTTEIVLAAWRAGKTVLVPKVDMAPRRMLPLEICSLDSGLAQSSYGIREPIGGKPWPVETIDFIVVPALAYDRRGHRLGRGAGFYDRFLGQPQRRAVACGLGFCEQLVDELPVQEHDCPLDLLVTDREVVRYVRDGRQG